MSEKPIHIAARAAYHFAQRRAGAPLRPKPVIETIVVDVDGTITRKDSPKLALERLCGPKKASEIIDGYMQDVILGRIKLDEIHSSIFRELYDRGFKRSDWPALMMELDRGGGLRTDMIETLMEIARWKSISTVVATRASLESAEWLMKRFGFQAAVGSVESNSNGSFAGFDTVIGAADNLDNGVMTKMTAAAIALRSLGTEMDPARTAVLTNDLLDALEMLCSARGILLFTDKPNKLERLTLLLGLYDSKIHERENLSSRLLSLL